MLLHAGWPVAVVQFIKHYHGCSTSEISGIYYGLDNKCSCNPGGLATVRRTQVNPTQPPQRALW